MIIDSLMSGGKERRLVQLLKGFTSGNEVKAELVILSDRIHYKEIYDLGINIHIIKRKPAMDPRVYYKLFGICRKFKPDIMQSWDSMGSIFTFPVAKYCGIKFINGMIVSAPKQIKVFSNLWLRSRISFPFSDIILSNSKTGLVSFKVNPKKAYYIHNGMDLSRFDKLEDPATVKQALGIKTPFIVGMVAAFSTRKDYKTFLKAGKKITEERKDTTFVCVGTGNLLESSKNSIPEHLKDFFVFTGESNKVESLINVFDIGVLATIIEGIPNAVMEYMYLAKPVVATNVGGTNELICDESHGFLTNKGDDKAMYEKMQFLLNNKNIANATGQSARERIIANFTLEKMTGNFIELYEKVLEGKSLFQ